ncbi:HEAT repeat protein [Planctomycetes bacterium CA13]|uniref:HEAT repeat protein n=1 Tax=Novipirellula herctigrandis TaxID=2527986 RepID=A0A5C5YX04_9BACT|nr:HEAT repeat protein [Planctomycetes bacterium CA13]
MNPTRHFLVFLLAFFSLFASLRVGHAEQEANSELVSLILELLADEDSDVRALALEQIRSEAPGETSTQKFAAQLQQLPADGQVGLLRALAARGDASARPAMIKLFSSTDDPAVIEATINAIGLVGNVEDVPMLTGQIAGSDDTLAKAASESLIRLQGDTVPAAIVAQLRTSAPEMQAKLIGVLARRRALDTIPTMLDATVSTSAVVRQAAMTGLSELAGPDDIAAMLKGVMAAQRGKERETAEKRVMIACQRIKRPEQQAKPLLDAMPRFSGPDQVILLSTLGRIGGNDALAIIESAIANSDAVKHDMGVRALCNWPNASVAEQLIKQIKSDVHAGHKLSALRSLIRVAPLADGRDDIEKLDLLKQAIGMCQRDTEIQYALSRTSAIRIPETLRFLLPYTDQPKFAENACLAIVELAHHRSVREPNKEEFDAALDKVIATSKDAIVIDRANRYKEGKTWVRP